MLKRIINYLKSNQIDCHANKSAFTLAETLIVMGIIGVVAALTLPNLNSSTGDKEKVVKLKKIYSNLEDAFGRAKAVYGPIDEWYNVSSGSNKDWSKKVAERFIEFMKISKNCELTGTSCWAGGTISARDDSPTVDTDDYKFLLSDGTSVGFYCHNPNNTIDRRMCMIYVDIDGPNKGVLEYGKDVFEFDIFEDGNLLPYGVGSSGNYSKWGDYFSENTTYWVIKNGNMDYLKLDSSNKCNGIQLNWDTQTSCK